MSRFFSKKYAHLVPYTPGEQPKDQKYIKLNTNESPFPPSEAVALAVRDAAKKSHLYSDPECRELMRTWCEVMGNTPDEVLFTNGSDEILNFAFMAFCDDEHPAVFPNITYGFYSVFAEINNVPYTEIPLKEDFTVNVEDYVGIHKNIFLANPNAPTGISLPLCEIERIVASNPDNIVLIDEAYVDFGGESAIPLVRKYENLIVTGTFSKSRSMAGARLGFGIASPALIRDLSAIKYSTNPYNVNAMTQAAGIATLRENDQILQNCRTIISTREYTQAELARLGFTMTDSRTNFIFAKHPEVSGEYLYTALRQKGILVRHFTKPEIAEYNRITVGSRLEMEALIKAIKEILSDLGR